MTAFQVAGHCLTTLDLAPILRSLCQRRASPGVRKVQERSDDLQVTATYLGSDGPASPPGPSRGPAFGSAGNQSRKSLGLFFQDVDEDGGSNYE